MQRGYGKLNGAANFGTKSISTTVSLEREHNFDVMARILLNGDLRFRPICDFNELGVAKIARSTTSAR